MQAAIIILVFVLTYVGMAAGRLPWLQVDRTGIALLGVILLLATEALTLDDVGANIDMPTLVLLFALMIISAQFAAAGFYDKCARWITEAPGRPTVLLALTVAVCGGLSALLANDIVIFALVPLLIVGVRARGLDPRPFVIALAAATNAGSAATIIGNPQNILIGEIGNLSFSTFLVACGVPAVVSLVLVFGVIWLVWHRRMTDPEPAAPIDIPTVPTHPHDRNQTIKGLVAMLALIGLFMTSLPREIGALVIAALLLANRKFTSRTMIASVDWPLLLLFACLFGVTGALADTGIPWTGISALQEWGLLPDSLFILTPLTLLMSNTIGNVPSVILLMQIWPNPPKGALYGLALLSTLSGNLLLVGSLANLMVVERAATFGVRLSFAEHAKVGIPVTILSIAFAVIWLAYMDWLPWLPESW
ncbi:MAG: anion transporter [Alphaproteobacteria bacterium]|nr:anion transporter [Alphaproteobacteria bacterium]